MEKVCVAVRVRPSASTDSANGFVWKVESNRISLHRSQGTPVSGISFAFDHVLDQECSNGMVYELLAKDIIAAAVEGFNGTVFAYGQTSSGKTFTMNGSEVNPGIIHRAVKDVFAKIEKISDREFLIRVSYMEIYNEEINDLFTVENQKLHIHESLECGVFVAGLREEIVNSPDQVLNLINVGEANRHFGYTSMNAHSSRSHTIFRMVIESKGKDNSSSNSSCSDDAIRIATLNLVDLAGSERVAKTGAGGVRLKEGKHINKSLMILGNVINKLSEGGKQRSHIPYRDSKLTRILQPALGGNAKTSIICTVAPDEIHIEETKGTLQFASRAKRITNCVQVNEILTDGALLKRQQLEIEELRSKLQGSHVEVLEQEILKLRNDMLKYELERERLATELEQERRSHIGCDLRIKEHQMKIGNFRNSATSESDGSFAHICVNECDGSINSDSMHQQDCFNTPCFKKMPNVFVAKRSYSIQPESSPIPDAFGDFADEDTWMKMNKGFKTDLDLLHMTPARKIQSFPISEDCSTVDRNQEIQQLHKQLKIVTDEREELKMKYLEQMTFTDQINREISYIQQEVLLIQKVPDNLNETVESTKDIFRNIISVLQNIVIKEKSTTARVFSITDGSTLMDGHKEESSKDIKGTLGGQISRWKQAKEIELNITKQRCEALEKATKVNNQLLKVSEGKFSSLEREFQLLKEDKEAALHRISSSSKMLAEVIDQRDRALKKLESEVRKRTKLEEEIKSFHNAFVRQRSSISSFQSDFKSILDTMKVQYSTAPELTSVE